MTNHQHTQQQRDELAQIAYRNMYDNPESPRIQPLHERSTSEIARHYRTADDALAAGYRKPRTIPDEHFVSDRYGNYAVEYPEKTIIKAADGSIWYRDEDGDWSTLGMGSGRLSGPATVLYSPEAAR